MPSPVPGPWPPAKPYRGVHFVLTPAEAQALFGALEFSLNTEPTALQRQELLRGLYPLRLQEIQDKLASDMKDAGISWQAVGT